MVHILDHGAVLECFPDRKCNTHKGDYGRILLICGSRGYTGAAALSAMGALRVGAGLVYLGVPESIYEIEAVKLSEPIVFPLPDHDGKLSKKAIKKLTKLISRMDAVLVGPGLGRGRQVESVVRFIAQTAKCPLVLDADGINALSAHKDILRGRTGITIITPHEGEFQRFAGKNIGNREKDAVALARELGIIVVLKGYETLITDGADLFKNPTGNPGMAVGGCGDVLAGMIMGLLGQGVDPLMCAACGAWLHGAAGDLCAQQMGQYGMLPSDMLSVLPRLLKQGVVK